MPETLNFNTISVMKHFYHQLKAYVAFAQMH